LDKIFAENPFGVHGDGAIWGHRMEYQDLL